MKNTFVKIAMLTAVFFSVSCAISEPVTSVASPMQAAKVDMPKLDGPGGPVPCFPGPVCPPGQ